MSWDAAKRVIQVISVADGKTEDEIRVRRMEYEKENEFSPDTAYLARSVSVKQYFEGFKGLAT